MAANLKQRHELQVPSSSSPPPPVMASLPASTATAGRPPSTFHSINDPSYVRILDTTLRDGEQAPGAAMTTEQKIVIARNLVLLGVDVIDAGFPVSSPEDFNAVKSIADEVGNVQHGGGLGGHVPIIVVVARTLKRDIDAAWAAVSGALRPRIATFIATSEIHMKHKLKKNADEVVAIAREMVTSDKDFVCRIFGEAIKAGARTVIIADTTVGCSLPSEISRLVAYIKAHTPGIENASISLHCHNDLGLANANTLAGIEAGAREVEVTINGIGERAGNAALEEVVMAIKCRKELMGGLYTGVNTKYISAISKMVVQYTGLNVQSYKAIVGANAFSHESGIHQDGILKFRGTYEFISSEDIGLDQTSESGIVLGKLRYLLLFPLPTILCYDACAMAFLPAIIAPTVYPLLALKSSNDPSYVRILDTTLRDGEQAPGGAMTAEQKVAVARNLVLLGVDVIDAGFPISSPEDFNAVKLIAGEVGNIQGGHEPVIMAAARCSKMDIDTAWAALSGARRPRIGTFIATSEIHMKHKLKKSEDEVVAIAREMVAYARSIGFQDISFAAEDSLRSDKDFLCRIFGEVIKAGARTVIIADTVGCSMPSEIGGFVAYVRDHTPGIENAIVSVHCHNDLGLANANTLAGIEAGAREVEVTINGIGERAGNAALEEVVMAIKCRKELMGGLYTGVNTKYLIATSKMVVEYTGLNVQPHKAIVGANAFSHESGIHQDGVLKFKGTYEFISREDIGLDPTSEPSIVLGKLSGRHALKSRLLKLGYDLDGTELDDIFKKFKLLTAKKKNITNDDIEELVCSKSMQSEPIWSLRYLQVMHGTMGFSTAVVKLLNLDGQERIACSMGRGPVDAAYKAIDNIIQVEFRTTN
ncbi:hypothetical protein M5K25_028164 [Dendrobium thyrsiflorum]|uniref:2-isopropylmalate synthase n=1 Tax=Dendrobium thyrsiflorum TaxID=117978 RepID=A0ABD0TVT2_DENTH